MSCADKLTEPEIDFLIRTLEETTLGEKRTKRQCERVCRIMNKLSFMRGELPLPIYSDVEICMGEHEEI